MHPSPPRQSQAAVPQWIGRYEVLVPIASGGMATVYLARTRGIGGFERDVAIKVTHAHLREESAFAQNLVEEAKLAVRIRHPNVVSILDIGDDPYGLFLVMDYVEGDSLAGLTRRAGTADVPALPPAYGLRILLDAMAGLHAAHELRGDDGAPLGLVHRDFSPQNILVGVDGTSRLADFGIAKAASRLGNTQTGTLKGKIGYMSPEQARGHPIDRRCDVWAAGVIAWEILAGRRMHGPELDDVTILLKLVTEPAPLLRTQKPDLPQAVEEAVARALSIPLEGRWPTAAAFSRGLLEACRAGGIFPAELSDVGELVQHLAGPKLTRRRAHAAEVTTLHERKTHLTDLTPSEIRLPLPSAPAADAGHEDEPPTVAMASGMPAPPEVTRTAAISVVTSSHAPAPATRRASPARWAVLAGAAVVGVAGLVGVLAISRSKPSESEAPAPAATTVAAAPSALPSPPAEVTASAAPAIEALATAAPAEPAPRLAITADAPIAAVKLGGRKVTVAPPARETTVELTGDEAGHALRVEVVSVDGRRAGAGVEAGGTKATFKFPAAGAVAPAQLAPSPYGRHP